MHGKDLFINNGSDRKTVETVGKSLPKLDVIPTLACGDHKSVKDKGASSLMR